MIVMIQKIKAKVCCCCYWQSPKTRSDVEMAEPLNSGAAVANYVPESERSNLASNNFWNSLPNWSPVGKQFSIIHLMAPININIVHRTAAQEGYGGLVYRERHTLGSTCFPTIYGLLTTILVLLLILLLGIFMIFPGAERCLRCVVQPSKTKRVRDLMFSGCTP